MIAAARTSLISALQDAMPWHSPTSVQAIADEAIRGWERDGWHAAPGRPTAARTSAPGPRSDFDPAAGPLRAA